MATGVKSPEERVRFSEFEFDCGARELKKNGQTLRLEPQPAKVLSVLIRNAGEIVTRQELIREVWGSETFVDFDQGLNYTIRRIRAALDDGADAPRFLETIPKTGYRFIAQITRSNPGGEASIEQAAPPRTRSGPKPNRLTLVGLVFIPVLMLSAVVVWMDRHRDPVTGSRARLTSLAVLPLRNLSTDPEQEYFSDGMTDELITDLAKTTGIRVISHTSVERYKNTTEPLPQIARELGVDAIVEGAVTRAGNRVRITTQLIDARNDTHIWADSYEREATDTLAIQDLLAQEIVNQIRGNVLPARPLLQPSTKNVPAAALDSYMRGRYLWNQRNPQTIGRAKEYFQDAVGQAPEFALAYSGLADCYWAYWGGVHDLALAERYARKALSLDPELAEAHASLGIVRLTERRVNEARPELLSAIDLNPNYAMAHHFYSGYLLDRGLPEDALVENDRARQLDPFGIAVNAIRPVILIHLHRFDDALVQAGKLAELEPQDPTPYIYMTRIYWSQKRVPEALEAARKEAAAEHQEQWLRDQTDLEETYRRVGVEPTLVRAAELMAKDEHPVAAAFEYGNLHNPEKVLQLLRTNVDNGDIVTEIRSAPEFDFLRHDPRFLEIEHHIYPDF